MRVKVQKWGNSLALRIPKSLAEQISIKQGSSIDLILEDGKLVANPIAQEEYELKTLLSKVKETNLHREYLSDKPKGRELW